MGDLATPSKFWTELGAEHQQQLDEHGPEQVKRQQALRYFTWRWGKDRLKGSEQAKFLRRHSHPSDWVAAFRPPLRASGPEWHDVDWTPFERRAFVVGSRLVWRYAERHGDPKVIALPEPELGDPLPVKLGGRLISQDIANSSLEVAAMVRALGDKEPERIIEVGGGYGRSAYALLSRFPNAKYTIVDIEPAASISKWYLGQLFPGRFEVIDPDAALKLPDGAFDLAISISTMQEMTKEQVKGYLELFDRLAADGVVYLKQWKDWFNPVDDVTVRFPEDYPAPARWQQVFEGDAPLQTYFGEAAWKVPSGR